MAERRAMRNGGEREPTKQPMRGNNDSDDDNRAEKKKRKKTERRRGRRSGGEQETRGAKSRRRRRKMAKNVATHTSAEPFGSRVGRRGVGAMSKRR